MVDQIKERVPELVAKYSQAKDTTYQRMVPIVLKKGLENINLDMFGEETQKQIYDAVGEDDEDIL